MDDFVITRVYRASNFGYENSFTYRISSDVFNGKSAFRGHIAEIIVFDYETSDDERHKIEGYLYHKWGATISKFRADHPYKESPPMVGEEVPDEPDVPVTPVVSKDFLPDIAKQYCIK